MRLINPNHQREEDLDTVCEKIINTPKIKIIFDAPKMLNNYGAIQLFILILDFSLLLPIKLIKRLRAITFAITELEER